MDSSENQPKDLKPIPPQAPPGEEGLLSLEDLDQLIREEDGEFDDVVNTINSGTLSTDTKIDLLDLDALMAEEEARSFKARMRRWRKRLVGYYVHVRASTMYLLKTGGPRLAQYVFGKIKTFMANRQEALRQFGFKPLKYKLTVFGFIAICAVCATLAILLFRNGLPQEKPLFIQSMGAIAEGSGTYDPKTEIEPFYDSVRAAQNVFTLRKLAVNLSPTGKTSAPMAAMELIVEGNSSDVVIEVKARENEFRDAFMRTIEEFTYEQLDTVPGKQKLLDQLLREANRIVTKGQVRKIYYTNIVIKP